MKDALVSLCHRFARQIRQNGVLCLTHDGDPSLQAAFAALGWADAQPLHLAVASRAPEAAVVRDPERAVLPKAEPR
jgi:hypothetical protein